MVDKRITQLKDSLVQLNDIWTLINSDGDKTELTKINQKLFSLEEKYNQYYEEAQGLGRLQLLKQDRVDEMTYLFEQMSYMVNNKPEGASLNLHSSYDESDGGSPAAAYSDRGVSPKSQDDCMTPCRGGYVSGYDQLLAVPLAHTPKPVKGLSIAVEYVTNVEYETVPSYMKCRMKVTVVNEFIDCFNNVLSAKYDYLKQGRANLRNNNHKIYDIYAKWKQQEKENKGEYFCTDSDFLLLNNSKLSKKEHNIITILRHLKRVRQNKTKGCLYFIACF